MNAATRCAKLLRDRRRDSEHVEIATLRGVRSAYAWFVHPSAQTVTQTWGRLTNAPYLDDIVVPTLLRARERVG